MVVDAFCNRQPNVLVNKTHDDLGKWNMHISVLFHSSITQHNDRLPTTNILSYVAAAIAFTCSKPGGKGSCDVA